MIRLPPRPTRTDTLFPYTTLFRSVLGGGRVVTIAEVIYTNQAVTFNWPRASALAIALTVLTVIIMAAYQRIAGARSRRQAALVGGGSMNEMAASVPVSPAAGEERKSVV